MDDGEVSENVECERPDLSPGARPLGSAPAGLSVVGPAGPAFCFALLFGVILFDA